MVLVCVYSFWFCPRSWRKQKSLASEREREREIFWDNLAGFYKNLWSCRIKDNQFLSKTPKWQPLVLSCEIQQLVAQKTSPRTCFTRRRCSTITNAVCGLRSSGAASILLRVCDLKMQDQEWGFCLLCFKQKYVNKLRETIAKWLHCHQYFIRPWRHHARSRVTNRYLHLHSIQIHTIWCNWVQFFLAPKSWFLAQLNFLLIILCQEFWDCWKLKHCIQPFT